MTTIEPSLAIIEVSPEPEAPTGTLAIASLAAIARARAEDRGPGTIEELPSGRHRLRFRVGGKLTTAGVFDSRPIAEEQRLAMIAEFARRQAPAPTDALAAFGDRVLEERELGGVVKDSENEESRWRNHVRGDRLANGHPGIGAMAPRDVEAEDVRAWLKRLFQRGLGRQTRIHCLNLLRAVLEEAIEQHVHRGPNPCAGIRLKKERRTHETWTFLDPEQQGRLFAAAAALGPEVEIVRFATGAGLRGGELVALRLEDVHVAGAEPHVVVRYGDMAGDATKSGKPRRVDLLPLALDALERWLAALPSFCPDNPKGLVFPGRRGGMRNHDHVLRWDVWKGFAERGKPGEARHRARRVGLVERAGLPPELRWHDLRHTCASSLINGWWGRMWTLAEVQQVLGHSSSKTTERYAHLAESAQRRAAAETRAAFHARSTGGGGGGGGGENPEQSRGSGTRVSNPRPSAWEEEAQANDLTLLGARGTVRGTPRELLTAIADRAPAELVNALSHRLATEVLASRAVLLAKEILRGGERALVAASELALLVGTDGETEEVALASGDER
jgi:integrase